MVPKAPASLKSLTNPTATAQRRALAMDASTAMVSAHCPDERRASITVQVGPSSATTGTAVTSRVPVRASSTGISNTPRPWVSLPLRSPSETQLATTRACSSEKPSSPSTRR